MSGAYALDRWDVLQFYGRRWTGSAKGVFECRHDEIQAPLTLRLRQGYRDIDEAPTANCYCLFDGRDRLIAFERLYVVAASWDASKI